MYSSIVVGGSVGVNVGVGAGVDVGAGVGVSVRVGVGPGVGVSMGVGSSVGVPRSVIPRSLSAPSLRSSSITETAKPMLCTGLPLSVSSILDVLTPITLPSLSTRGPPLLPGFIAASVCHRSTPPVFLAEEMMPRVTVKLLPILSGSGKPSASTLVAYPNATRISNRDGVEMPAAVYPHQRKVGGCVPLQHVAVITVPAGQPDAHPSRTSYYMRVGYDQPIRVDNEPGAAGAAGGYLHHTRLNIRDEVRKRRFAFAGQIVGAKELHIDSRGSWRRRRGG